MNQYHSVDGLENENAEVLGPNEISYRIFEKLPEMTMEPHDNDLDRNEKMDRIIVLI